MTVTYTAEVSTSSGFGCFLKLLAKWRGSVYKLIWCDLIAFVLAYYVINIIYRFALVGEYKELFENAITYCKAYGDLIPLSFVLGFYINLITTRWWNQYASIPYPDNLAILVSAIIKEQNDRCKLLRRTIMRYVCLTFSMTMTMVSPSIKKRFPTVNHLVESGLMHKDEKKIFDELEAEFPSYTKYWLPLTWAANVITKSRADGIIKDDVAVKELLKEINIFRTRCGTILDYDWISIPLVYTQVVTMAVYFYFFASLLAQQSEEIYFPFITILELIFYIGWLRVAETMINPFGEDDDDFEVFWLVDRHVQVSYLIVDKVHQDHPKLARDQYWSKSAPNVLPYTLASEKFMMEYPSSSTRDIKVKGNESEMYMPDERRITTERDGKSNKHSRRDSLMSRIFSNRKQRSMSHRLSKINDAALNEATTIESDIEKDMVSDPSEFNALRMQRREQHQKRMKKLLRLMRNENDETENRLINEITSVY